MKKTIQTLQEYSLPLIAGVIAAMIWANVSPGSYKALVHTPIHRIGTIFDHAEEHGEPAAQAESHATATSDADHGEVADSSDGEKHAAADGHGGLDHYLSLHFLINDIFMALFFGVAAKEITEACLPNGSLNPVSKAINPLFATIGGVVGPVAVFISLNTVLGDPAWKNGWGIPTATDIALAWLVMKFLFGARHPAVSFLLLLAVADDAIGLGIIAIGYPDPNYPTQWFNLVWCIPGILIALGLRMNKVQNWVPYIAIGGAFCWWGLYSAHLHPALALVFVVPFLPGPNKDMGLYVDDGADPHDSPLEKFEHALKGIVDFGLFFFALVNAGVAFGEISGLSWLVVASLIIGKMTGVTGFSLLAMKLGFPLPEGMGRRHLLATGAVSGLGLTVALFVCGQAFTSESLQGAAKMGAVFSVAAAAIGLGLKVGLKIPGMQDTASGSDAEPKDPGSAGAEPSAAVETSKAADQPSEERADDVLAEPVKA